MRSLRKFWIEAGAKCREGSRALLLLFLGTYKAVFAVHLGGTCRFEPSCSDYAVEAAKTHSPLVAIGLIVRRLLSCRPGGRWGFDPVPPRTFSKFACSQDACSKG